MTDVSVIIPTYNEDAYIGGLLSFLCSIAKHDHRLKEIIVVDAHSSDRTTDVVRSHPVRLIHSDRKNRAHQLNLGTSHATGDIFYFVHADVRPPDQFMDNILQAIQNGCQFGCFAYEFDSDSFLLKLNSRFTRADSKFIGGGDQTLFIDKLTFTALGGYRENHILMEDFELYWRAGRTYRSCIIQNNVKVSPRKYVRNSWLRVQFANFIVFNAYRLGVSQQQLVSIYRSLLHQ